MTKKKAKCTKKEKSKKLDDSIMDNKLYEIHFLIENFFYIKLKIKEL
jgi:hypothetical protein